MKHSTAEAGRCAAGGDYETSLFDRFYDLRNRNFFYRGRARIIEALLKSDAGKIICRPGKIKIVDVGFGHGSKVSKDSLPDAITVGVDINYNSLSRIKDRVGADTVLVNADIRALPFKESFDMAMALDILEHVDDDALALDMIYRSCKKGALLIMTVPATPSMYGRFDRLAFHKKRYSAEELRKKLEKAGFSVKKLSYFISILFPLIYLYRKLRELFVRRDQDVSIADMAETRTVPFVNGLCMATMIAESIMISRLDLPFGSSIVALAKKE